MGSQPLTWEGGTNLQTSDQSTASTPLTARPGYVGKLNYIYTVKLGYNEQLGTGQIWFVITGKDFILRISTLQIP